MTDLQVFKPMFPANGYQLRALLIEGEPWFVAADVCGILDVINPSHAVKRLDNDEYQQVALSLVSNDPSDRNRKATLVSEPGLYGLVLGSRKDEAVLFKRWIKHEVLPSIRKTGGYGVQRALSPRELAQMVIEAEDRADAATAELEAAKPAIEAHAAYLDSTGTMSMATAAQMLGIGQNRLFRELREHRVLIGTAGIRLNTPYQPYIAPKGWFVVKAGTRERSSGETEATYTTRVTPKGLDGIRKLLAG